MAKPCCPEKTRKPLGSGIRKVGVGGGGRRPLLGELGTTKTHDPGELAWSPIVMYLKHTIK